MCEEGYINDYGKLETSGGRYPSLYGLNPESGYFIGVDIKKFAINIGLINFKGDMVELKMNIPFKSENTSEALEELCKLILQFIKKVDIDNDKILNININVSGRVNPESGYSFSQFNFEERPLAEVLTEKIGFRVTIDNDTRAMTYGEYMKGCVKGEKDIIFVNVSWGLGIGIIIDGKIYTGKSGFSGEFGHTNVFDNEIICHCGKKGCLETEASGSALHRILIERIQNGESSILSNRILSKDNVLSLEQGEMKYFNIARAVDISPLQEYLTEIINTTDNTIQKRLLKTHLKEVQRLSLNGEIVERQSFLMINAKHDDNAEKDLLKRCLDLSNKFERCSIKTEILDEPSLVQLCNSFLNMNYAHREDTDIEDKVLMLKEA